ncbi:MAG: DUF3786 domain-containing protein [Acidimicrobiia bacterium]|nr:DUF3786 domain-containing protein [Acidimicrobiia bacterium]
MLSDRSGPRPEEKWIDQLAPKLAGLRAALRHLPPPVIAERSGAVLRDQSLLLTMLFRPYTVDTATYIARQPGGPEVNSFFQALLLTYLHTADGAPPAGRWMSFRDLPDGGFYHQAFQGYTGDRLVRKWQLDLEGFATACRSLGGSPVDLGSAGFSLEVLPHVTLAAVYWLGDEDLPSRATILFDASAPHYMVVDGLAILGSHLAGQILAGNPKPGT